MRNHIRSVGNTPNITFVVIADNSPDKDGRITRNQKTKKVFASECMAGLYMCDLIEKFEVVHIFTNYQIRTTYERLMI